METSGLFTHILSLQTSRELFCAANPNPDEIKADRCAARQIDKLHENPISDWGDSKRLEIFAQRAASDMIAFQSLTGFRRFSQLPIGKYVIPNFDAYLNPVYRLTLLAGSVSNSKDQPRLCGDSASLFAHGVQTSYQQCGGDGQVSDELLALVPSGVEDSWNGAPWNDKTISCNIDWVSLLRSSATGARFRSNLAFGAPLPRWYGRDAGDRLIMNCQRIGGGKVISEL